MNGNLGIHIHAYNIIKAIWMNLRYARKRKTESEELSNEKIVTNEVRSTTDPDDLPIDIVNLIGSDLFGRDRACFRAVCKTWRCSIPMAIPHSTFLDTEEMTEFPHIYTNGSFYHPILNKTYILDMPYITQDGYKIRYSKDGWFLISQSHHMFFFNPFTRKRINLPDLPIYYNFKSICFSSVPTSRDCIVFGIINTHDDTDVTFSYILHGQYTWTRKSATTTYKNKCQRQFIASHTNPVFNNGLFYCFGRNGKLATVDSKTWTWKVLVSLETPPLSFSIRRNYLLVDWNGDIISVFEDNLGSSIEIFKMNYPLKTWRKVESLGDKMLFLSNNGCVTSHVRGMENTIFFQRFHRNSSVFYSLNTSKFHTLCSGYSSHNFCDTTFRADSTWIYPCFQTSPDANFRWSLV